MRSLFFCFFFFLYTFRILILRPLEGLFDWSPSKRLRGNGMRLSVISSDIVMDNVRARSGSCHCVPQRISWNGVVFNGPRNRQTPRSPVSFYESTVYGRDKKKKKKQTNSIKLCPRVRRQKMQSETIHGASRHGIYCYGEEFPVARPSLSPWVRNEYNFSQKPSVPHLG